MVNWHSVKTRVLGLGLAFLLLLLAQATFMVLTTHESLSSSQSLSAFTLQKLNLANDAKLSVVQVQQFLSDISATRGQNGLNDGLDQAKAHAAQFREDMRKLKQIDPDNQSHYDDIIQAFEPYFDIGQKMAKVYVDQGPAGGNAMMPQFDKAAGVLGDRLDSFVEQAVKQTQMETLMLSEQLRLSRNWTLGLSTLMILGLVLLIWMIFRSIRQLPEVTSALTLIARGDLSGDPLKVVGKDEISQLASATNSMRSELHGLVGGILQAADTLVASVTRLSAGLNQASVQLDQQSQETELVASAMEELQSSVADIAGHTSSAAGAATQADESVMKGRQVLEPLLADVNRLANDISGTATLMSEVEQESHEIGGILSVIQSVAEQTNLLALNAAIEAARAGETGRGFAVVADEVRELAGKVQSASHDIQRMIESLQSRIQSAVASMEAGRETSTKGAEMANRAQEEFDAIGAAVGSLNDMNIQVASTTEEQSAVAEDMSRRVQQISLASGEAVAGVAESSKAGEALLQEAQGLKHMVSRFRV